VRRRIVHDIENGIKGWQNFGRVAVRTGAGTILSLFRLSEAGKALAGGRWAKLPMSRTKIL
jgi:hypothetical protein